MATEAKSAFTRIDIQLRAPAAYITLQNPPLNVINLQMMRELRVALEFVANRPELSAIVFAGSDRAFSSGVDVAVHAPESVQEMLQTFHAVIRLIVAARKLTIACVRRHCLGGGAELALVCDVVYAAPDSVWGFPEIKLGCYPPVASAALSAIVGQKLAAEMILTGRTLTGHEAFAAGLVNAVAEAPESLVDECVKRLAQLSPASLAVAKKAFYAWDAMHFDKGLARAEQIYLEELMKTEDAQEGIAAYLQHRRPVWTGK